MVNSRQLPQYREVTCSKVSTGWDSGRTQAALSRAQFLNTLRRSKMRTLTISLLATFFIVALTLSFMPGGATHAFAQGQPKTASTQSAGNSTSPAQVVALDECDPNT